MHFGTRKGIPVCPFDISSTGGPPRNRSRRCLLFLDLPLPGRVVVGKFIWDKNKMCRPVVFFFLFSFFSPLSFCVLLSIAVNDTTPGPLESRHTRRVLLRGPKVQYTEGKPLFRETIFSFPERRNIMTGERIFPLARLLLNAPLGGGKAFGTASRFPTVIRELSCLCLLNSSRRAPVRIVTGRPRRTFHSGHQWSADLTTSTAFVGPLLAQPKSLTDNNKKGIPPGQISPGALLLAFYCRRPFTA